MAARRRREPVAPLPSQSTWFTRHGALLVVAAAYVLIAIVRLRLAGIPLERDEGEYAFGGHLLLQGIPPYVLVYSMKLPGVMAAYGAIMAIFGQDAWGIRVGLLVVNAASTFTLFSVVRRLVSDRAAAVAALAFALLTVDRWIMGIWAHATHFAVLAVIAGILVLLRALESNRAALLAGAGALFGAAIVMRQSAAAFVAFAVLYLVWSGLQARTIARPSRAMFTRTALFIAGVSIPLVAVAAAASWSGAWDAFWLWTFDYPRAYVSEVPLSEAWSSFVAGWTTITRATLPIWLVGLAGCAMVWLARWKTDTRLFVTGLLVASFLALIPGFYFRAHYFIQVVPVIAVGAGIAIVSLERALEGRVSRTIAQVLPLVLFAACAAAYLVTERDFLMSMTPREVMRSRFSLNPFVEAPEIGRYIRERTTAEDRIAVLGSEPEIYFYVGRKSATGFIYTYPLMEPQPFASRMQGDMIAEVEAARPKYVVISEMHVSWMARASSDTRIFKWMDDLPARCYELVGVVDIQSDDVSTLVWDAAARTYNPRSPNVLRTFRRTVDGPCAASGQAISRGAQPNRAR